MSNWDTWDDKADVVVQPHKIPSFQAGGEDSGNAAWTDSGTTWRDSNRFQTGNRFPSRGRGRGGRNDFNRGRSEFTRGGRGFSSGVRGGNNGRDRNIPRDDENYEILKIPTRYVGRVIGKYTIFSLILLLKHKGIFKTGYIFVTEIGI